MHTTIVLRSKKKCGRIRLRFRLTDGRNVYLYHKSGIYADIKDVRRFFPDGSLKKQLKVLPPVSLQNAIKREIRMMEKVYLEYQPINSLVYESLILSYRSQKRKSKPDSDRGHSDDSFISRLSNYIDHGLFGNARKKAYLATQRSLETFLSITGRGAIKVNDVNKDLLLEFHSFLSNEKIYVDEHIPSYDKAGIRLAGLRHNNTVAGKMKQLKAFFSYLEDTEVIEKSPFRKFGKLNRIRTMSQRYSNPVFLRRNELLLLKKASVTPSLEEIRDAFLLQCALGCRISDFMGLSEKNIRIDENGIPYIHYRPKKTINSDNPNGIKTPLVKFAYDIAIKRKFNFSFFKKARAVHSYNENIRKLLEYVGITREVETLSEGKIEYVPIFSTASSKLARKTHIDICNKIQINLYVTGHHRQGSAAVKHYSRLELKDLFSLMNAAFEESDFRIRKEST